MRKLIFLFLFFTPFLVACVTVPENTFIVTSDQLQQRQIETRRYDGISEKDLIHAGAAVLQDIGFSLDDSETQLGVISGSKDRSAFEPGEVIAFIVVAALTGAASPISKEQTIKVALVVRPVRTSNGEDIPKSQFIRVSFQRKVIRTDGSVWVETLKDQKLYQDFYERVSKAVFLEGQKV